MTKIANVPQGASGTVNQQKWQLLEQIYKLYPLKKGIKVDGNGDYDFDDKLLTNVKTAEIAPSGDGKALTARYFLDAFQPILWNFNDSFWGSFCPKPACKAASAPTDGPLGNGNIPLAGVLPGGGLMIDGVAYTANQAPDAWTVMSAAVGYTYADRPYAAQFANPILLIHQTNPAENGIYNFFTQAGFYQLVRTFPTNNAYHLYPGCHTVVYGGTVNKATMWQCAYAQWNPSDIFDPQVILFKKMSAGGAASVAPSSGATTAADIQTKLNQVIASLQGM